MADTKTSPNKDNYLLAGVRIYARKRGGSAYYCLGNATGVSLINERETLDHFTSWTGSRKRDRQDIISETFALEFTLDEFNSENLGLFFASNADAIDYAQSSGSQSSTSVTAVLGKSIKLGHRSITSNTFVATEGTTVLTEGTDYEVDYDLGIMTFLRGSAQVQDSDSIDIEYDFAEVDGEQFYPGSLTGVQELDSFYIAVIGNQGEVHEWSGVNANIRANGPMSIGDTDWSTLPFRIEILASTNASQPYGTYRVYR
jgi:hypothetical protein